MPATIARQSHGDTAACFNDFAQAWGFTSPDFVNIAKYNGKLGSEVIRGLARTGRRNPQRFPQITHFETRRAEVPATMGRQSHGETAVCFNYFEQA